jgi:predicted amidophosphoribosyltransferase
LTVSGRKNNVKGAFAVTDPSAVRARTILVVDDVMTTGATLGEIAATLKIAGAWRVWALAVARG